MRNNNTNNASCAFNEQLVDCLYGEITSREKLKLEAHIKNCLSCADEFAAFGIVRESVAEWREETFVNLETPIFNFPAETFQTIETGKQSGSWFSELRKLFVFQPAAAMAVLAVLVACAGIIFYSVNFVKVDDVVEVNKNDIQKAAVTPTIEKVLVPSVIEEPDKPASQLNEKQNLDFERQPRTIPNKTTVKISNRADDLAPAREIKTPQSREKKTPSVKPQMPSLTVTDEVEDKSIRLADLFEEIGTE